MCKAHFISCFANSCNLIKFLKQYLNIFVRNFVSCIQIRFVSTEKNYAHRLACILLILMSDINKGVSNTKIISFADDTRVYNNVNTVDDCNVLQSDLESVYNWADVNNMLFNTSKFDDFSFACQNNFLSSNVNPDLNIISQHDNVNDLGMLMSYDCSFEKHILSVSSRCSSLAGWILRTFASRDKLTMLTLFKSVVLSRLDDGSLALNPYKVKDISLLESVQRAFTKHINGIVPNLNNPITCYNSIIRGR